MVVWTKDELEREQVRGVFALGILAALLAYGTVRSNAPPKDAIEISVDFIGLMLLGFWGIYVTATAISMTSWFATGYWKSTLLIFKSAGQVAFFIGSIETVGVVGLFGPLILLESVQTSLQHASDILLAIVVTTIMFGIVGIYRLIKGRGRIR